MVVMNSSPYFKTGHSDRELLWEVGPVNHVTNKELVKSTECQTKLMFYFNPADSMVANFGRQVGLLPYFSLNPELEAKSQTWREICGYIF